MYAVSLLDASLCAGVYGDVMRVKILYNKRDSALVQFKEPQHAQTGMFTSGERLVAIHIANGSLICYFSSGCGVHIIRSFLVALKHKNTVEMLASNFSVNLSNR